jgi:hypothetical protein
MNASAVGARKYGEGPELQRTIAQWNPHGPNPPGISHEELVLVRRSRQAAGRHDAEDIAALCFDICAEQPPQHFEDRRMPPDRVEFGQDGYGPLQLDEGPIIDTTDRPPPVQLHDAGTQSFDGGCTEETPTVQIPIVRRRRIG